MNLDTLRASLTRRTSIDIQAAFARFQDEAAEVDGDAFLAFLHREKLIDDATLAELLDDETVDVSVDVSADADPVATGPKRATRRFLRKLLPADVQLAAELVRRAWIPRDHVAAALDELARGASGARSLAQLLRATGRLDATQLRELARDPTNAICPSCGEPIPQGSPPPHLVARLASGTTGDIYIARDIELGRKVAYKRLQEEMTAHRPIIERFLVEAQITAQLDHPGIVPIHALEVDAAGRPGYTMKLVRGKTFKEWIGEIGRRYELGEPLEESMQLAARLEPVLKVCDALHYAHRKGVLHRDLKPANIMLGRYGEVYVMDWGVAALRGQIPSEGTARLDLSTLSTTSRDGTDTEDGQLVGTPAYMSPEQAHGSNAELDVRSDLFSLGLILFQLVTMKRAVPGTSAKEVLANIRLGRLEPIVHAHGEPIPASLAAVIAKATAYDRDARYTDARQLALDLRRFLRGEPVRAALRPVRRFEPSQWLRAHWRVVAIYVALVALAGLAFAAGQRYQAALGGT